LAIQETKMEVISQKKKLYSLWGGEECDWAYLPSVGNSGGILSIWRKSIASFNFSFVGEGYVGLCLDWGGVKAYIFVINVYSKSDLPANKRLWYRLLELRRSLGEGVWCILGDFNMVGGSDERKGVNG